ASPALSSPWRRLWEGRTPTSGRVTRFARPFRRREGPRAGRCRRTLRVLVAEKSWEGLAENPDEAHDAPNSPVAAVLTIKGGANDKGPCFKYTDPDQAWDRIALIAQVLAFDEIPGP